MVNTTVLVGWRTDGLHNENIPPADVVLDLDKDLALGKPRDLHGAQGDLEIVRHAPGQFRIGIAAENHQSRIRNHVILRSAEES